MVTGCTIFLIVSTVLSSGIKLENSTVRYGLSFTEGVCTAKIEGTHNHDYFITTTAHSMEIEQFNIRTKSLVFGSLSVYSRFNVGHINYKVTKTEYTQKIHDIAYKVWVQTDGHYSKNRI